jgi:osomolarity two-component system sensor histidine kinase CHK1
LALPDVDSKAERFAESMYPRICLSEDEILAIADLPPLENETVALLQKILCKMVKPAYLSCPRYFCAVIYLSFYNTVTHGLSPYSACIHLRVSDIVPLLHIGGNLAINAVNQQDLTRSHAYGRLAIRILDVLNVPSELACPVYKVYASHVLLWHRPLIETQKYYHLALTTGSKTYHSIWGFLATFDSAVCAMFSGESLQQAASKFADTKKIVDTRKIPLERYWVSLPKKLLYSLMGIVPPDHTLVELKSDWAKAEAHAKAVRMNMYLFNLQTFRLVEAVFMGSPEVGLKAARTCEQYSDSVPGTLPFAMYIFYSAVMYIDVFDQLLKADYTQLHKHVELIRLWAQSSPWTYQHKYLFLTVMMAKKEVNDLAMLDAYDEAISLALEHGFVQDAALYAERCARWLNTCSPKRSVLYLNDAKQYYEAWGANAKADKISSFLQSRGFCTSFRGLLI